jgi:hypothetical protein
MACRFCRLGSGFSAFDVLFEEPSGVRIRVRLVPGALEGPGDPKPDCMFKSPSCGQRVQSTT